MIKSSPFLLIIVVIFSCGQYELPTPQEKEEFTVLNADLSNLVFLGSSMFAGMEDGAISKVGISNSIPNLLLTELFSMSSTNTSVLKLSEGVEFNLFENETINGNVGRYQLFFPSADTLGFSLKILPGQSFAYASELSSQLQTFVFPEAKIVDFTETGRNVNPYISSLLPNPSTSLLDIITASDPTFFILDVSEEVVGYAIHGAEGSLNSTDFMASEYTDILDEALFEQKLEELIAKMLAPEGSKGMIMNIPDFLKFPFFLKSFGGSRPYLQNTAQQSGAFANLAEYNAQILSGGLQQQIGNLTFITDSESPYWHFILEDRNLPDAILNGEALPKVRISIANPARQEEEEELIFFQYIMRASMGAGLGPGIGNEYYYPIPEDGYLRIDEIKSIESKIMAYNEIIDRVVQRHSEQVVVVDIHEFYEDLFNGLNLFLENPPQGKSINGVQFDPLVSKFGIFSADGISLNGRGNALIANEIIKTINNHFSGNIHQLNPNKYPGTSFEYQ